MRKNLKAIFDKFPENKQNALRDLKPELNELVLAAERNIMSKTTRNGYGYWLGVFSGTLAPVAQYLVLCAAVDTDISDAQFEGISDGYKAAVGN